MISVSITFLKYDSDIKELQQIMTMFNNFKQFQSWVSLDEHQSFISDVIWTFSDDWRAKLTHINKYRKEVLHIYLYINWKVNCKYPRVMLLFFRLLESQKIILTYTLKKFYIIHLKKWKSCIPDKDYRKFTTVLLFFFKFLGVTKKCLTTLVLTKCLLRG